MSKKTVSIPANVGSNLISEVFGNISLSKEVKDFLSAIDAELNIRYVAGAEKPIIELLSKTGKKVCDLEEFKKLSQYRRFVNDAMKQADKAVSTNKKIELVALLMRQAATRLITLPPRIMEQNMTKFNQLGSSLEIISGHKKAIDDAMDNDYKTYIVDKLDRVSRLIITTQIMCLGSDLVEKDYIATELRNIGVPKWIYNKFLDKNFTNNLNYDCKTLLFPKNNYFKSISFSTVELNDEEFLAANTAVLEKSGGIIRLAKSDFSALYPSYDTNLEEQVEAYLAKYQWVLTNPSTADEVLTLRETGKFPPVFKEAMAPRTSGSKQRPETELGKITREVSNVLGRIQSVWNGILNFVIPVSNPKESFWNLIYPDVTWNISPTRSIYDCIRDERNLAPLNAIREATSTVILTRICAIMSVVSGIPTDSPLNLTISTPVMTILNRQGYRALGTFTDNLQADHPLGDLAGIANMPVAENETVAAKAFLNIKEAKSGKARRSAMAMVRLDKSVYKELRSMEGHPIYDDVINWLMSSFKTGNRKLLQSVATELILGEAQHNSDTIFGSDRDRYTISEDDDDDSDSD